MIRILLADDHPIVREGLRAVLETQPDFEVIGTPQQAADGEEALRLSLELQPDILLLDLEMPVIDGVETIRRLRQRVRQQSAQGRQKTAPRIIVFTAFDTMSVSSRLWKRGPMATCSRARPAKISSMPFASLCRVARCYSRWSPRNS